MPGGDFILLFAFVVLGMGGVALWIVCWVLSKLRK